jgi:hypothetical protein
MSECPDPDLRDVFRLLYEDADWAASDDEVSCPCPSQLQIIIDKEK